MTARLARLRLDVCPYPFDRVEIGRVGGQQEHRQPLTLGNQLAHDVGDVSVEPVPDQHDRRLDEVMDAVDESDEVPLVHAAARVFARPVGAQTVAQPASAIPAACRSARPRTRPERRR
jgi:hypothetical protein